MSIKRQSSRPPWLFSVSHIINTRTGSMTTTLPSATYWPRKTACTKPTSTALPMTTTFYCSRRLVQQRLWEIQDEWTARKAEEIQGYGDRSEWANFYSVIKAVYDPPNKAAAPLRSANDSTLLTEKTQILQR
ncbi:hypothetical protein SprV_0200711600 [Sparganum proliferum]